MATDTIGTDQPKVVVEGTELTAQAYRDLVEFRVQTGVRSIGRVVLRFDDPVYEHSQNSSFFAIDAQVTIATVGTTSGTLFTGEVVERAVDFTASGTVLEIVALDRSHRLTVPTSVQARLRGRLPDIATTLVGAQGMTAKVQSAPGAETFEWTATAGTGLGIIDEIAERYGYDWTVHGREFHLWPAADGSPGAATAVPLDTDGDLQSFSVRAGRSLDRSVTVRGWDDQKQSAIVGKSTPPRRRNTSPFLDLGKGETPATERTDLNPVTQTDATNLANVAAAQPRTIARGTTRLNARITPGATVRVSGVGPTSGSYYVREVVHEYTDHGSRTRFVAGDRDAPRLVDARPAGPAASTFVHHGALIGIVTRVDTDHPRVKVKLPTIGDQFETDWARVMMLGAGKDTGLLILPEVNDEVLVLFPDGDLRSAVVVGGLHSDKRVPGSKATTRDTAKAVDGRAWSSKLQHHVELADGSAPGRQHVKLGLGNGPQYIRVGKDKVEIDAPGNVPIRIGNPQAWIEIGTSGDITIQATKITVKATQAVEIEGTTVKATGKAETTIEGNAKLQLKGGATAALEASGITTVKGSMVQIN